MDFKDTQCKILIYLQCLRICIHIYEYKKMIDYNNGSMRHLYVVVEGREQKKRREREQVRKEQQNCNK